MFRSREDANAYQREYRKNKGVKEKYQKLNKEWYLANPVFAMVRNAKKRASERSLPFDLEWRSLEIPERCPLLGIPLIHGKGKLHENSPTIDRIDSTKGYTKDNIWIVSFRANSIKRDASIEEFETILSNWRTKIGHSPPNFR